MAMKSFDSYMAESGQQSALDSLRSSGGYDSALSQYNKTGSYGSSGSLSGITLADVGGSALDYANTLNAKDTAAFDAYKMAAGGFQKPLELYNQLEEQAGLPKLKQTATSLQGQIDSIEDTLRRVEGNVGATTRNSLVTEAQRQGIVGERQKPLLENLGVMTTGLGRVQQSIDRAGADIGNKVGLYLQGREQELEPFKMQIQMVADQSARLMTGFTADRQTQLDLLMDKLQRQRQLEDREWDLANQLAQEERSYSQAKDQFIFEQENAQASTEIVTVGGRKKLINKTTGEVIADLGSSSVGGGGSSWFNSGTTATNSPWSVVPNGQNVKGDYTYNGNSIQSYWD
jgi:hypothetical protein